MPSTIEFPAEFLWGAATSAYQIEGSLEWSLGYFKRFGIVHVDFATQQRTLKDSARFYSRVIATKGRVLNDAAS